MDWKQKWPDRVSPSGRVKQSLTREQKLEIFIYRASQVHGGAYDYSKAVYGTAKDKITIVCPDHGEFAQLPENHILKASGCPSCSGKKKKTTEEFIRESLSVHGDLYDYSNVCYTNNSTKVFIKCSLHGEFLQAPSHHLNGHGCPSCGGTKQLTTDQFVSKANEVHNFKYSYPESYSNYATKMTIVCPEHGAFTQTPHKHLSGQGCASCSHSLSTHVYLLRYQDGFYKIGITNNVFARVNRLMLSYGSNITVVYCKEVNSPRKIEQFLLNKFINKPNISSKFEGYTELRVLSEEEVEEICLYLDQN